MCILVYMSETQNITENWNDFLTAGVSYYSTDKATDRLSCPMCGRTHYWCNCS